MAWHYNRINWEDNITPLSAKNLNKMDQAIYDLSENMYELTSLRDSFPEWKQGIVQDVQSTVKDLPERIASIESKLLTTSFDSKTGTLRIKLKTP